MNGFEKITPIKYNKKYSLPHEFAVKARMEPTQNISILTTKRIKFKYLSSSLAN